MDRRTFITLTALGLLGGCANTMTGSRNPWAGNYPSLVGNNRSQILKCLKIGMVNVEGTLHEKFQLLKEVGFDGVEMDSPSGVDWDEVVQARDDTGLVIPGVVCSTHWGKPLSSPDPAVRRSGIEGMETALRDCRKVGGWTVLLVPGVCNKEVSYEQAWERSTEAVKELIPLAEELKVQIAFENVWNNFITKADEAVRYVDQFESSTVGWYFDTGNIVRYEEPVDWVRKLNSRILKLDIKDYSRKLMEAEGVWAGFRCKIGDPDSSVGWADVMAEIRKLGFCGWGSAEVSGGGKERLADISKRMDDVFNR